MRSSRQPHFDRSIQQLLDEELQAEAQLDQMDKNIHALQNKVIAKDWWDGNFIIRWSRHLNDQKDHSLYLHPKDRWFSISSVTSHPSTQLLRIEDKLLNNNQIHSKTDARKKFEMRPKKRKGKEEKKNEVQEGEKVKKRRRIRRPNRSKKTVNRTGQKKGVMKKRQ